MTRQDFLDYLDVNGCRVVRVANQGYAVVRNEKNDKMSGVPATDPPLHATVCRICKTLEIDPPKEADGAKELIDHIHDQFGERGLSPDNGNI